jgi:glycine/D-amino acid oxidase-like deaminating enzyme
MQDDSRSHGLWEASAPPGPAAPPLKGRALADVVVIGAGFTGLSAALHLAQGGASVAVLEAVDIGFGGSGRNVGLVNAGMWVMPQALPGELGPLHGGRLLELLANGPSLVYDIVERHGIDCEAVRRGTLHCAVGASGLANIAERARQWQALGAPVTLLDAKETAEKTGTRAYRGALLDMRAGTIQPLAYARGLAQAAVAAGARLHAHSPVVKVEDVGTHWRVHCSSGGMVDAQWVVVATNAYTGPDGVWPQLGAELVRLPYFNMATAPLSAKLRELILPGLQGAWDTRDVLSSFRLDQAGRLVFGSVGALRGTGLDIHRAWGRRALAKLFPALGSVEFEHEWYGWIGMTPNALPRFHQLARNTISFSGYNGRGIATGTTFGQQLARLVLGQIKEDDLPLPVTQAEPVSLKPLREAYYEVGAQVAHLASARF